MSKHHTKRNNFNKKPNNQVAKVDMRGNWEAAFFQRGKIKIDEQCIKSNCPTGSFNPYNIPDLMNPRLSKEEDILEKKNNGIALTKTENMIIDNYLDKQSKRIKNDLEKLEEYGLNAKPDTDEGRIRLLFKTIQYYIASGSPKSDEMVYYAFNKINELNPSEKLLKEYEESITKIKKIIADLDIIDLQFNRFHSNMPPLNEKGFVRLDPFQKEVITNIDNNISTIVQAPTSAGKSILTGYLYTKKIFENNSDRMLRAIVVVPSDPLAWQMSAMIGKITKKDIPLITRTFQSDTTREGLIKKIKSVGIVVGTPQYLVDFLPLLSDIKFDWLVVDEIHMIGKESCKEMEVVIKAYNDIPILALSATIGNADMLKDWFIKIGHKDMVIVKCDKRFFNLQKFYYDKGRTDNALVRIHPFSMLTFDDIKSGSILTLTLNPTPPDIWDVAIKINSLLPPILKIKTYFGNNTRITLDQTNEYFTKLLNWMVENCDKPKYKKKIEEIISQYQLEDIKDKSFDLYDITMHLKKNNKTPALIFQTDSHLCLEYVRKFSKTIREEEEKAYPNLLEQRLKEQQRIRNESKKAEQVLMVEDRTTGTKGAKKAVKVNLDKAGEKKLTKLMMINDNFDQLNEKPADVAIYEPHPDFILNNNQQFSQYMINEWDKELKSFFPHHGSEYHYMIDLLWRGVGVYCKGLPDPYLHIVQNLACDGKLGIVFSDDSLVFGVSMPFRTTIITPDENINSMMYHQMAGRAGRRGLDKEGNVVLVGYKPEKIHELTSSCIPHINGCDTMFYGANYGKLLSTGTRWENIKKNFLLDKITDEVAEEFYSGINENLNDGWSFALNDNIGFKHMMWRFRHCDDGFRIAFLLSFIRKIYKYSDGEIEKNQIEISKFLSNYIEIHESKNDCIIEQTEQSIKFNIKEHLETLGLETIDNIDGRVFESIRMNKLYETENRKEKSILRERLLTFGEKVRNIQHYFFHCSEEKITVLLGKLLTRIWWIYHMSSPVMEPIDRYDIQEEIMNLQLSSSDNSDSDEE
jgi:hypothetical protein